MAGDTKLALALLALVLARAAAIGITSSTEQGSIMKEGEEFSLTCTSSQPW